jgi:hypothetical protein
MATGLARPGPALAQGSASTTPGAAQATPAVPANEHAGHEQHDAHAPAASLFSTRDASGTAWLPDLSPMYGAHRKAGPWELMLHGNAFGQFLYESGTEHHDSQQAGSINWLMGMASRPVGSARVAVHAMVSLEPWTIRGCGYPNLLATGEVCDGDSIHDRQHPHDLFMEIAASYDRPLAGSVRWQVYGGLAGEPALGPPGFPHRLSARPNPVSPISHHWLDSTHITFGLVTAGVYGPRWKVEGSAFNGREPDAARKGLDLAAPDSVAGRIALAPTPRVALQVSAALLREAEAGIGAEPPTDVTRVTASLTYHRPLGSIGLWATTMAYGLNAERATIPGDVLDETTHAALVETAATFGDRHTWFGRFEVVGKPAHDLHAHEFIREVFTVGKIEAGYTRHLKPWNGLLPGVGAMAMASVVPPLLAPRYGGRVAPGFGVFMTVRPTGHP